MGTMVDKLCTGASYWWEDRTIGRLDMSVTSGNNKDYDIGVYIHMEKPKDIGDNPRKVDVDFVNGDVIEALVVKKLAETANMIYMDQHSEYKVEVKAEMDIWESTQNIFVEFLDDETKKPSGVAESKAEELVIVFVKIFEKDYDKRMTKFDVVYKVCLKRVLFLKWCELQLEQGSIEAKNGGDKNKKIGYIVPIKRLELFRQWSLHMSEIDYINSVYLTPEDGGIE